MALSLFPHPSEVLMALQGLSSSWMPGTKEGALPSWNTCPVPGAVPGVRGHSGDEMVLGFTELML